MLSPADAHSALFISWQVTVYEQEGDTYALQVSGILLDGSRLDVRDYLFAEGTCKYAYNGWTAPDVCADVGTTRPTGPMSRPLPTMYIALITTLLLPPALRIPKACSSVLLPG